MQVIHSENRVPLGQDVLNQTVSGKSSGFQQIFQEKITSPGKNIPATATGATKSHNQDKYRVCLGTITAETPTVSHLLYKSAHKNDCWNILANDVNADKPFTRIQSGTRIYMDTRTDEINWESSRPQSMGTIGRGKTIADNGHLESGIGSDNNLDKSGTRVASASLQPPADTEAKAGIGPSAGGAVPLSSATGLDQAVGAFIGTSYSRMNCYELVVEGLERMGVQYKGAQGLSRHLMNQASRQGRSAYSLHSGEGLSRAIGSDVFTASIPRVTGVSSQARDMMNQMSDVLQEGQILSFSTPTRGHTGVISRKDGEWTFINSGVMDNNLSGRNGGRAVGEEHLDEEIKNWFTRARKSGSGLTITLGAVDTEKLARFQSETPRVSQSV